MLQPLGFFSDKPFKPHLTVFRIKKKIGDITEELEKQKTIDFGFKKSQRLNLKKVNLHQMDQSILI